MIKLNFKEPIGSGKSPIKDFMGFNPIGTWLYKQLEFVTCRIFSSFLLIREQVIFFRHYGLIKNINL